MTLPKHARAVVIGGGIAGCSTAFHLAEMGWRDIVLIERNTLTSGTTWHAAGDVVPIRPSPELTRFVRRSIELYPQLSRETEQDIGWKHCGVMTCLPSEGRRIDQSRLAAYARSLGADVSIISRDEISAIQPFIRTDDLSGAMYTKDAYRVNPADVTQAIAKGARARGVTIRENTRVTGFDIVERDGFREVRAVETTSGRIQCETVVIACGAWSRDVGRMAGIAIPLHAVCHSYLITNRIDGVTARLPITRDPDSYIYSREEVGGFLIGFFEPKAKPLSRAQLPDELSFANLPEDWDHLGPHVERAIHRYPPLEEAGIKLLFTGPESFTPDGLFMIGPAPGMRGTYVLTGFNSSGIALSGGAGQALAEWIIDGEPTFDVSHLDVRRYPRMMANTRWVAERTTELPSWLFGVPWPRREHQAARRLRTSALYERIASRGARFGQVAGWERANWFNPRGVDVDESPTYGRPGWLDLARGEHEAVRSAVGISDRTQMAKLMVEGPDAESLLQTACANDVGRPAGSVVYTAMLNRNGGFESDFTVTRLGETRFLVVTGANEGGRDADILRRMAVDRRASVTDVTSAFVGLAVNGPRSRDLLQGLSDDDLSDQAFPYMTAREIGIGPATAWAMRLSYAGELGWEIYLPAENATAAYDAIHEAGADLGLRDVGAYALDSLRLEKGYLAWGRDISNRETPIEAGLGFAVRFSKAVPFIGRDALLRQRDEGVRQRLITLIVDGDSAFPVGNEPIWRDGAVVGRTTSAGYGHSVNGTIAIGIVRNGGGVVDETFLATGRYEIEFADRKLPARVSPRAPYDPDGLRLRG
jgi:sarcosine dehydrogenase